jgi:hypothetical protein
MQLRIAAVVAVLLVLFSARSVGAQPADAPVAGVEDDPEVLAAACSESFELAQRHRQDQKLRAARTQLLVCGHERCPDLIKAKCVGWLHDVDEEMPSIVIVAKDAQGGDTRDVRVLIDGELVAGKLDGGAILVDPGPHSVRFERDDAPDVVVDIVAALGVKNRVVDVAFAPPPPLPVPVTPAPPLPAGPPAPLPSPLPLPEEPNTSPLPALMAAGFAVGTVGLIVGTIVGVISLNRGAELEEQCQVECSAEEIASGETVSHVSTASFVIGGLGTALGVVSLVLYLREDGGTTSALRFGPGSVSLTTRF